jgi:hypothetical protein
MTAGISALARQYEVEAFLWRQLRELGALRLRALRLGDDREARALGVARNRCLAELARTHVRTLGDDLLTAA